MELFSEIHSRYFYIISEILKTAAVRKLTGEDIAATVSRLGFAETSLELTPQLLNITNNGYFLLKNDSSGYIPLVENVPPLTLTTLQKRWLKAIIEDKRFALFADKNERNFYRSLLSDIEPLYNPNHLITVDMASDGDPYDSDEYKNIFSTILQAIQTGKVLLIRYESGKGNRLSSYFAPYKLEYSMKDDKFRLVCVRVRQKKFRSLYKLNLSRITSVELMDWNTLSDLAGYVQSLRVPEPIEIEITNERNGFERIFTQLSNFERVSEYFEDTKCCLMKIYYYEVDEMELLITLLSFGPVIRILGPERFKKQAVERITAQKQLFISNDDI
ncbi:WYL domain-containing protein [Sporomusa acidovorans]|uniref:WYL domain-containing protein n=1 Tax=Sporomusa acidovorans (strain ATCC 49682 / DSM 3132 / Mol) TaxID=1123286 RepID=A0ABZ3JCE7_SPOA4|nr:WYL domain-containing protein [Sporomusa acidovorans]OZC22723.1 hypothetical protein SPACI_12690 [Sporomusa acidovorans DSM 3132]SDE79805.1 Predicted DNA-binding transcriptional regulator YafY, contains an HTH and WYL domains [Sporomusa acidovorans]